MDETAVDNGGDDAAMKCLAVEGSIATLRSGPRDIKSPDHFRVENRNVGASAASQRATILKLEDTRRIRSAKLDQPLQRNHARLNEMFHRQSHGRFETDDSTRRLIEFERLFISMVRRVLTGD